MGKKGGNEPPKEEKPRKRAGSGFRPPTPPETSSPRVCSACNGHLYETRPQIESDESGVFDGDSNIKCRHCKGTGVEPS